MGFDSNLLLLLVYAFVCCVVGVGLYVGLSRGPSLKRWIKAGGSPAYYRLVRKELLSGPKAALVGLGSAVLLLLPMVLDLAVSHAMTLSRDAGTAIFLTKFAAVTVNRRQYPLPEIQDCVLEYDRGVPRLSLVLANGLRMTPLSSGFDSTIGIDQTQGLINDFLAASKIARNPTLSQKPEKPCALIADGAQSETRTHTGGYPGGF